MQEVIMKQVIISSILMLAIFILAGCGPTFVNPLPAPDPPRPDKSLEGVWRHDEKDEQDIVMFIRRDDGWMDILIVATKYKPNSMEVMRFEGFCSQIGKDAFLSVREVGDPDESQKSEGWYLAQYKTSRKKLEFRVFSAGKSAELVEAGRLEGDVEEGTNKVTRVTSTSDELAGLIRREGAQVFMDDDPPAVFKKLK
jgi:hypothetical protein